MASATPFDPPRLEAVQASARRKIFRRLLPYLFVLYIIAYLDRVNISFANLEMSKALRFSDQVFGFGAGVFFFGYFLLEIPGAVIVERWSARKWIARIMVSWGIVTAILAFVHTPLQFYTTRFLLGAAEAGFFPGLIVYLTHWFRNADRAKAVGLLMAAVPLSNVIGAPISGQMLKIAWLGVPGWRWLFILQGVPAVIFGIVTLFYLTDRPEQAKWLTDEERDWISGELARERAEKTAARSLKTLQALRQPDVIKLALIYFTSVTGTYGVTFFLPTILKRAGGLSNTAVTTLAILPFATGFLAMQFNAWHSDRHNERRLHVAIPVGFASLALAASAFAASRPETNIYLVVALFCCVMAGLNGYLPAFWAFATMTLAESAGAAAVGMINSIGNLGGFMGPNALGSLHDHFHSFWPGIAVLSLGAGISSMIAVSIKQHRIKG